MTKYQVFNGKNEWIGREFDTYEQADRFRKGLKHTDMDDDGLHVVEKRLMTYRVLAFLPEENRWEDTTEGPFDSYEQAENFARAEVGMLWWIEPTATPASMSASELNAENDRLERRRETLIAELEREYGISFDLSKLTSGKRRQLERAQGDPRWKKLIAEYRVVREQIDAEFPDRVIARLPEGHVRRNRKS